MKDSDTLLHICSTECSSSFDNDKIHQEEGLLSVVLLFWRQTGGRKKTMVGKAKSMI
jgi:hypothetical protein